MKTTIIAIANQKGDVGKTSTGFKVLLIDSEPRSSFSISLGYSQPDLLPFALSDAMERIITDQPITPAERIIHQSDTR